ncbi:MAG TPA: hypothetical protein VML55_19055, partial [Planctomycetaceae bacterium]|nr:hypothetical protein [Planctomycetaceae bacterium]
MPRSAAPRARSISGSPPRTAARRTASDRKRPRSTSSDSKNSLWIMLGAGGGVAALLIVVALVAFGLGRTDAPAPAGDTPQVTAADGANEPPADRASSGSPAPP